MMPQYEQPPVEPSPGPSFWVDLRAAFQGRHLDYTSGSLSRAIILLAIPMVLEMLGQSIFGIVDIFFVGKLGVDAVSAVGMTDSLLVIVWTLGMGLSMAATAMVARLIGEKDPEAAGVAAAQVLILGTLVSLPISALGIFFASDMLRLMGATPGMIEVGSIYCAIIFGTNGVIIFLFLINAIFRGAGDAVLAMKSLWLANIFNMILDPLLIFGIGPFPELGVMGAAVATSVGRGLGVAYQVYLLFWGTGRVPVGWATFRLHVGMIRRLIRIALPGVVQYGVGTASWLVIFGILAAFGSDALAGYTIAIRILIFALLPSWGMGAAAATLVGQNLGAGKPDRAEGSVWVTSFVNMAFLGVVAAAMLFYAEPLVRIFTDEDAVVAYGVDCLEIVSYTYVLFAFGMVIVQAFNGAGDTRTPTWINFVSYWMLQLPLAYLLAHLLGLGASGVFIAIAVTQAILAVISIVVFRQGRWKQTVI